jgi:hypothetical protein
VSCQPKLSYGDFIARFKISAPRCSHFCRKILSKILLQDFWSLLSPFWPFLCLSFHWPSMIPPALFQSLPTYPLPFANHDFQTLTHILALPSPFLVIWHLGLICTVPSSTLQHPPVPSRKSCNPTSNFEFL